MIYEECLLDCRKHPYNPNRMPPMDIEELQQLSTICNKLGIARTTLQSAIDREEVTVYRSKDKYPMAKEEDIVAWNANKDKRRPGPKVKS